MNECCRHKTDPDHYNARESALIPDNNAVPGKMKPEGVRDYTKLGRMTGQSNVRPWYHR